MHSDNTSANQNGDQAGTGATPPSFAWQGDNSAQNGGSGQASDSAVNPQVAAEPATPEAPSPVNNSFGAYPPMPPVAAPELSTAQPSNFPAGNPNAGDAMGTAPMGGYNPPVNPYSAAPQQPAAQPTNPVASPSVAANPMNDPSGGYPPMPPVTAPAAAPMAHQPNPAAPPQPSAGGTPVGGGYYQPPAGNPAANNPMNDPFGGYPPMAGGDPLGGPMGGYNPPGNPYSAAPQQPAAPNPMANNPMNSPVNDPFGGYPPMPPMAGGDPLGGPMNPMGGGGTTGDDEDKEPANFQLGTLLPEKLSIPYPEHSLNFDENYFYRLLASSISLSRAEKKRIIDSVPKLKQSQIDELINIFEDEKKQFAALPKKHTKELEKLAQQHLNDWLDIEAEYKSAGQKEEETKKAEEIRKSLGL